MVHHYQLCTVPENIHSSPTEGQNENCKPEEGGKRKANVFKGKYGAKLQFLGGGGVQTKRNFGCRYGYFLEKDHH